MNQQFRDDRPEQLMRDKRYASLRSAPGRLTAGVLLATLLVAHGESAQGAGLPRIAAAAAQTYNIQASATPVTLAAKAQARVTVIAKLPPNAPSSPHVVLFRLNAQERVQLADMHDDGRSGDRRAGDLEYTCQVTLREGNAGEVRLQVVAAYPATGANLATRSASRTLYSAPIPLRVEQAQTGGTSDGPAAGGTTTGSGLGALLGKVLEGLLTADKGNQATDDGKKSGDPKPPAEDQKAPADVPLQAKGLRLSFPADWEFRDDILAMGGPIALRSFGDPQRGGVIPPGGAEIEITTSPADHLALEQIFSRDLGTVAVTRTAVGSSPALRAEYFDEFGPSLAYESSAVYVNRGAQIYKFFLSYRAGDAHRQDFIHTFDRVLASTQFEQE